MGESHWPVKKELSSEARKRAVVATSRGSAMRPSGVRLTTTVFMSGDIDCVNGVSMNPGHMAFTRMLREATTRATERVKERIPPAGMRVTTRAERHPRRWGSFRCKLAWL